jgi:hypothetical protein
MHSAYKVIYDVTQTHPPNITAPLVVGSILIIIGLIGLTLAKSTRRRGLLVVGIVTTVGGMLLTVGPIITTWQFNRFLSAYKEGRCKVIEGRVEKFRQMPSSGHGMESFEVAGHRFSYSDFRATPGFHQTRFRGGLMEAGINVRIHYLGNDIARLEIAE